jgi:cytochrome P450 family 142 subfamily A polypeptide 1
MHIDILNVNTWDGGMWERLRWLRENDPVHWDAKNEIWVLSTYDDVLYVSKHNEIFCSGEGTRPNMPTKLSIVDMDEPRHGQLRKLVNRGFTPRMVNKLEAYFRDLTTHYIDKVAGTGACDFVQAVSVPLPLHLIAEMMGIDPEDRDRFHHWSDVMIASDGRYDDAEQMAKAGAAFAEYIDYLGETIEERRAQPKDDLISILVHARDEGILGANEVRNEALLQKMGGAEAVSMAQDELKMFLVTLLIAGNETTRNAISGGVSALIENPAERRKLVENPALIASAVEEVCRYVSPVLNFARTATRDTELRGRRIRKGQKLLLVYPSANRDATVFEDPDAFRVDRTPNPHLAFGIGNHFCLGANLARMELRVVLGEVVRRMPDMEYTDGPPTMALSPLVRSFVSMPVRFTPAGPSGARAAAS